MKKIITLLMLALVPMASAFGGVQIGKEAIIAPGQSAEFRFLLYDIDGSLELSIEKPEGWEVTLDSLESARKEHIALGDSYQEARSLGVRIRPPLDAENGEVRVLATASSPGAGITVRNQQEFLFRVRVDRKEPSIIERLLGIARQLAGPVEKKPNGNVTDGLPNDLRNGTREIRDEINKTIDGLRGGFGGITGMIASNSPSLLKTLPILLALLFILLKVKVARKGSGWQLKN